MSETAQVSLFTHAHQVHLEGSPITIAQNHSYTGHHEGTKGGGFKAWKEVTTSAAFHNSGQHHEPPKCHPGTRKAILEKIMSWVKGEIDTETFVFWLNGTVGVGKSAIAQEIAEMCEKGLLLATFFFARSDATRNNARLLITTLAYQIALAIPPVRPYIEQVFEHDPLIDTRSLDTQAVKLLIEPLERAIADQIHIPPLIVIDGLDECLATSDQCKVLDIISHVGRTVNATSRRLVFLIVSRPEQEISLKFNSRMLEGVSTPYSIDPKSGDSYSDVHRFLEDGFNEIKNTHPLKSSIPPSWPSKDVLLALMWRADGQFLYAKLALSYTSSIRHRPQDRLATILHAAAEADENPFTALDTLYHHIFSTIDDVESLLTILGLHLTVECGSICEIVQERLGMEFEDIKLLFGDLASVVEVIKQDELSWSLTFRHASLVDFLINEKRSRQYHINGHSSHTKWAIWLLNQARSRQLGSRYPDILNHHFKYLTPSPEICGVLQTCGLVGLYWECGDHTSGINVEIVSWVCCTMYWIRSMACDDAEKLFQFQVGAFKRHIISLLGSCDTCPLTKFNVHLLLSASALCWLELLYPGSPPSSSALKCIFQLLPTDLDDTSSWPPLDLIQLPRIYPFLSALMQDSDAECSAPLRDAVESIRAAAAPVLLHYLSRPPELRRTPPFKWFLEKLKTRPWISRRRSSIRKKLRTWCKLYKFCSSCPPPNWPRWPDFPPHWLKCMRDHPGDMSHVWAYVSSSSSLSLPHITTLHENPRLLAYLYALVLLPEVLAKAPRSEELIASCKTHIFHRTSILFPRGTKAAQGAISKYLERLEAEERRWEELWLD